MDAETVQKGSTRKVVLTIYVGIIAGSITIVVATLPLGLYTVFFEQLSSTVSYVHTIHQLYFYIGLLPVFVPLEASVGSVFVGYYALYALLIVIAALQARNIGSAMKEGISKGSAVLLSNPLMGSLILLGALLFSTFLIDLFQTSVGVQVGGLSGDPLELFLSIVLAPVAEEIGFRLALIGIPIFIVGLLTVGPSHALHALWRPSAVWEEKADQDAGGLSPGRKSFVKLLVYFLLVLSSVLFGLAHYVSGAGWGLGKITEAGVAGLFLGYAYIRYGFHTDIIMHWSVNNLTAYAFFSQGLWNIPWDSNPGSNLSLATELFMVFLLGAPSLAFVGHRFLRSVIGADKQMQSAPAPFSIDIPGPAGESPQGGEEHRQTKTAGRPVSSSAPG